jgi:curved DNA-binding protein
MEFKDYYKVLGVESTADKKSIKNAYRRLARKYHPDVSSESDAENKFKSIAEAYAVLKDKQKRSEYDVMYEQVKSGQHKSTQQSHYQNNQAPAYDADFFESLFKQSDTRGRHGNIYRDRPISKGQDVEMTLEVSLEEALQGSSKTISFQLPNKKTPKKLKIAIPPETAEGELIRLKAQGLPGIKGGKAGDIYLRIIYQAHPYFDVEGLDLILTVPISPWEAALGTKIVIPTLTSKINLTIPPNSQTGKKLRIKNKGLKSKNRNGDLFAVFKIMMPDKSTTDIKELWKTLADKASFNPRPHWRK